jgi:hypothetical protein
MSFDINSSLEELEGIELGEPEFGSSLVLRAHHLYKQPLASFSVEDLRLMIGQGIGLPFLVPLALERLEKDPQVSGDYYPGDLRAAVLSVAREFWKEHPDLYQRVNELTPASASDDRQFDS